MTQHNYTSHLQLDNHGQLRHFLSIDGLPKKTLQQILSTAAKFIAPNQRIKVDKSILAERSIVNLFFENSTRTRSTFEIAAKNLGASVLNLNVAASSTQKGESLLDTIDNLQAMGAELAVIRHSASGAAEWVAQHANAPLAVINAGDGCHEHPSQAMLDVFTIQQHKPDLEQLCVCIIGDILHSRVARSLIHALNILGVPQIRIVAPKTLLPTNANQLGATVFHDLATGLKNADVIIALRLQTERMQSGRLPSKQEYYRYYGLTPERVGSAKPDAIIMHPGPINRGVEIDSTVANGAQAVILQQVHYGIAVRMAIMGLLLNPKALL